MAIIGGCYGFIFTVYDGLVFRGSSWSRIYQVSVLSHHKVNEDLIVHSDRGQEYSGHLMQDELKKAGIKSSVKKRPATNLTRVFFTSYSQLKHDKAEWHPSFITRENIIQINL